MRSLTLQQLLQGTDFGANLRESMAALNMTSLFDGLFAQTAGKLMAKTKLGGVVRVWAGWLAGPLP
jgi:hypothetical protein